ncbi:MAG: hypothetical protein Q9219_004998 [cf. Caloplaca sp. 3 TL-2023]
MDFALRCNHLKCRTQLNERAVVTTCRSVTQILKKVGTSLRQCSHIFCAACSQTLGLDAAPTTHRICPACETSLPNPDDVVSTQLNPTEDYKTSVLSGFSPSIILDRDKLQSENTNLVAAFREKSRKHQQTQELYDRLKRKEMTAATQSAAFESVDEVLANVNSRAGPARPQQQPFPSRPQGYRDGLQYQYDLGQDLSHHRIGSNGSGGSGGGMMPPPVRRPTVFGNHLFNNDKASPSQHRTQLGPQTQNVHQQNASRQSTGFAAAPSHNPTPLRQMPLGNMSASSVNRSNYGGYGMSAGAKIGRQSAPLPRRRIAQMDGSDGRDKEAINFLRVNFWYRQYEGKHYHPCPVSSAVAGKKATDPLKDQMKQQRLNGNLSYTANIVMISITRCDLQGAIRAEDVPGIPPIRFDSFETPFRETNGLRQLRHNVHVSGYRNSDLSRNVLEIIKSTTPREYAVQVTTIFLQSLTTFYSPTKALVPIPKVLPPRVPQTSSDSTIYIMTVPMQRTSTYTSLELDFDIPAPTTSRFTMIRRASLRPWQLVSMLTPASSPAPERPRSNSGGDSRGS